LDRFDSIGNGRHARRNAVQRRARPKARRTFSRTVPVVSAGISRESAGQGQPDRRTRRLLRLLRVPDGHRPVYRRGGQQDERFPADRPADQSERGTVQKRDRPHVGHKVNDDSFLGLSPPPPPAPPPRTPPPPPPRDDFFFNTPTHDDD